MHPVPILLVDDEERFVLNLAKLLKTRGFDVSTAFQGRQALDLLSSRKEIAVVVLDVHMPGMDGIETLRHIKEMNADIEVIMLTGQATMEDGVQALRQGAFDYVQKPCDIKELEARIMAACSVERIKRRPILWPRATAGDIILSGFVPLLPEHPLVRALTIFNRYPSGEGAQMLFVVDDGLRVQGIINRGDLLKAVPKASDGDIITWEWVQTHPDALPQIPVNLIMNRKVATATSETPLAETARLMLLHHYDTMPVVSQDTVLGIIRLRDVLRYMHAPEEKKGSGF